jgi:proteic killer suppression protein
VIRSFGDTGTEDLFYRRDSRAARKSCPQEAWSAARRKLDYLHAAKVLGDLVRLPADFKRLKGPMDGWCSLRVNDRYRVLFRWVNDAAEDVKVLDYH